MDNAINIAKKWLPPITEADKQIIFHTLNGTNKTFGIPLLHKYLEFLQPYVNVLQINDKPRESDLVASGIVFFYGCFFYIMHFPNWGKHIHDIFLYNLLYMLVDHYIDDIKLNINLKALAISQMFILIEDPTAKITYVDPILAVIAEIYTKLLTRCPHCKLAIIKLFKAEIEGLKIQRSANYSRAQYYDIACKKGGYTMQVLLGILNINDEKLLKDTYHLGTIMQLIDDSVDVLADRRNNINTIATYDLSTSVISTLDTLWIDIINRIDQIDPVFNMFKLIYTIFTVYLPGRIPNCYSDQLRIDVSALNLFEKIDGSGLLVDNINNELITMDILK